MTLEQVIEYASKQGQKTIFTGICSGKFCNNEFYKVFTSQKYCQEGCNTTQGTGTFVCVGCKKEFTRKNVRANRSKKPFCSRQCFYAFNHGEDHSGYKGKEFLSKKGYRIIHIGKRTLFEHRYFMEQHLGRKLLPTEIVHHINHVKTDNRLENLTIMSNAEHTTFHHALRGKGDISASPSQ